MYKRIYKDYEFIITDKIVCNNCDTYNYTYHMTRRTEQEMQELLYSPLRSQNPPTRVIKTLPPR